MEELKQKWAEYVEHVNDYLESTRMPRHLCDLSREKMLSFKAFMDWL